MALLLIHTAQRGETMQSIAQRYNVPYQAIVTENGGRVFVSAGDQVRVPAVTGPAPAWLPQPQNTLPPPGPQPDNTGMYVAAALALVLVLVLRRRS